MNIDKVTTYHKAVHETLGKSKTRLNDMMHETWFPTKQQGSEEIQILNMDQVIQLTKVNKSYFLNILQMMVDILRLQYNRKYLEDFGEPRAAHFTYEYNPNTQEITLYVSLRIKGISNKFLYQTSTTFRLDPNNKIVKAIGDEFLYMIALIGSRPQIHDKDDIREIIGSLSSGTASTAKKVYQQTNSIGPAQGQAAKDAVVSKDNTIRL